VLVASYTFLDVFWSMFVFFIWVMWFMLLFRIWGDIFSRHDISGLGKTGWLVFTILVPFLGVFIYLIAENDGMNKRALERARAQQDQMDEYVRSTAGGGAASEIERAKQLLDSGAITQTEFDSIKAKALA